MKTGKRCIEIKNRLTYALNKLTKVTDYSGASTTYSYDNAGRRTRMNYPNGISTVYTYDDASRLLKLENKKDSAVLSSYEYTYDNAGNRLSMLEKNGDKTTYVYDSNDRLISVRYPSGKFVNYTYDSSGNRMSERMEYGTTWNETDYYYDDNRLIKTELWVKGCKGVYKEAYYSYDNNGNLINKTEQGAAWIETTYGYDFENRLTKVTTPDATLSFNYCSCPTLTGIDGTYGDCGACGPSGKRISKTVNDKTIYTICFDPTMDFDQSGNIIARYVQNPIMLDEPISIETSQGKFYYLFDGLGSVTGLTNAGGSLVATYSYDAFGNILSETGDATLNAINPYRFTSRVYDKESGLYYYRARYYDSCVGRFISKDPLRSELREGNNLYVYVGNNSVNYKDPSGLSLAYCIALAWAYYDEACDKADDYYDDGKIGYDYRDKFAHAYIGCKVGRSWLCWSSDICAIALLKELAGYIGEKLGMPQGTGWSWDDYHATMWGYWNRNMGYWTGPWYWRTYVKYDCGYIASKCPYVK